MACHRRTCWSPVLSGCGPTRVLIVGLGYSGRAIAASLLRCGIDRVVGTTRHQEAPPPGVGTVTFDGTSVGAELRAAVEEATHLIVSVPPDADGDPALRCLGDVVRGAGSVRWIGYLSTVGVYGDHGGRWIDERAACHPTNERSRLRLAAEAAWRGLAGAIGAGLAIFRLAGIYGPGRSALDNLVAGTAHRVVKPGQVFNRIHVVDVASIVTAALIREAESVFNVADDEPAPPQDVVAAGAALLGVALPPEVPIAEAQLSPMALSFYGENKRIRNDRIKAELGVTLAFPTYREGLAALARDRALTPR